MARRYLLSCHVMAAILDVIELEIAPFDPPTLKPYLRTKHNVDLTSHSRDSDLKFPRWRPSAMLDLVQLEIDPIDPPSQKTLP